MNEPIKKRFAGSSQFFHARVRRISREQFGLQVKYGSATVEMPAHEVSGKFSIKFPRSLGRAGLLGGAVPDAAAERGDVDAVFFLWIEGDALDV